MTHQNPHFDEIKAHVFFYFFFYKTAPLPSLIQCPQTHLILPNTRSKGALSPRWHYKYGLLWKVWHPCLNNLIPHLCQDEMVFFFPECEISRKRRYVQSVMLCYCPLLHEWKSNTQNVLLLSHPWNVKWLEDTLKGNIFFYSVLVTCYNCN